MAINFVVVNLVETKRVILRMQVAIQENPEKGFWYVSLAAFVCAPFLTNDGVCLLMVEPILQAFRSTFATVQEGISDQPAVVTERAIASPNSKLEASDAIYFLLSLACSSNIGSALTYTGNPQNMIVSNLLALFNFISSLYCVSRSHRML